jgi:hypothetical protein
VLGKPEIRPAVAIAIYLEYKSNVALYRRLSDALRKAIMEGRLQARGADALN